MRIREKLMKNEAVVCIAGLGYVGQPLAEEFSKSLRVIGFDVNEDKIRKLNENNINNNMFVDDGSIDEVI